MPQFDRTVSDSVVATESLEVSWPVPTIGQVTPATGPSIGGTLLTILGSGFRLPTPPPFYGPTTPAPYDSVEVYFEGTVRGAPFSVKAERVDVVATTELWVRTPLVPPGIVAIRVTNVDDATGIPIPSETTIRAAMWTSVRVPLTEGDVVEGTCDYERVVERLIHMMRDGIVDEVVIGQDVDYAPDSDEPVTVAFAKLPAIALLGPDMPENRFYTGNDPIELRDGDEMVVKPPPLVVDLRFNLLGAAKTKKQLLRLETLMFAFFRRNKDVLILRDPNDPSLGYADFEVDLMMREPGLLDRTRAAMNTASIQTFACPLVIRAVPIENVPGFVDRVTDTVHERTGTVADDGYRLGGGSGPDESNVWPPETGAEQIRP